ncbi:hypothetical protein F5890DRAFT_1477446 [Lentinula detonsa]|uniref:Uncharacterized protein n=1 Tax=Lentinula detonsa TaxID=2804962 RepID=A0AA38UP45_9AGAR|nr:hypothetical protein F5890DRAFT_1477446 [Lentinula detonsa]
MTEQDHSRALTRLRIPLVSPPAWPRPPASKSSLATGTTPRSSEAASSASSAALFTTSSLDTTSTDLTSIMSCATQLSPGTKPEDIFTKPAQSKTDMVSPELQAHAQLLRQTRQMVEAIRRTCDILEKSTNFAAAAGPAIKVNEELRKLQRSLQEQKEVYEAQLQPLEEKLSLQLQEAIRGDFRDRALSLVKKRVREEIVNSINKELHLQIPLELHDQTAKHQSQMLEVNISIHNSEARAKNTTIRTANEHIHQLWLPSVKKAHSKFPPTVRALAEKSAEDVDLLLGAYNITMHHHSDKEPSAELTEKMNHFLNFIGVRLRVVPTSSTGKEGKKSSSTLVISACQ